MTKEEKENILQKLMQQKEICVKRVGTMYALGEIKGISDAIQIVEDMPITEPKETNLEHYYDELCGLCAKCGNLDKALEELYEKRVKKAYSLMEGLWWISREYKNPKYKLTQFEYDVLDTLFDKNERFNKDYQRDKLKKRGYFKDIQCDDDARVREILENCEVVNE